VAASYPDPAENKPSIDKNATTPAATRQIVTIHAENSGAPISSTPPLIRTTINPATSTQFSTQVSQPPTTSSSLNKPFTPALANTKPNYKIIHTIQAGETIYRVSKIYNVSVENIKQWNNLETNTVEIDQELVIIGGETNPTTVVYSGASPTKTNRNSSALFRNNVQYHTIQAGETVFKLSKIYGVSEDEIVKWNNLKNFWVIVGQRLVVKK
jgi:membrane-bound lytic murein transglycosylase D